MENHTKLPFPDLHEKVPRDPAASAAGKAYKDHWDAVYYRTEINRLGWYEAYPEPTLALIQAAGLDKGSRILSVGAGAGTLIDELLSLGYRHIIANDISPIALEKLKERLGVQGDEVQWIVDDLTHPTRLLSLEPVDLWQDRAVLHFFQKKEEQDTYFQLLKKLVRPGGYVILAAFNLSGATVCSGLPVHRYDHEMLAEKLGSDFELLTAFDHTCTMPSGDTRAYVYTLFKRR